MSTHTAELAALIEQRLGAIEAGQREVLAELRRGRQRVPKATPAKKRQHAAPTRPPADDLAKKIAARELRRLGL